MTAKGTIARAAVVPSHADGAVASANLMIIRLGPELLPEVLVAFLLHSNALLRLAGETSGTSSGTFFVTVKALGELTVPVPIMDIQLALARFLKASSASFSALEEVIRRKRALVNAVVGEVFVGHGLDAMVTKGAE